MTWGFLDRNNPLLIFSLSLSQNILRTQTTQLSELLCHEQLHMFVGFAHLSVK